MKLFFELVVIAVVGGFVYLKIAPRWDGWSKPLKPVASDIGPDAPMPGEVPGRAAAAMTMPVASGKIAPAEAQSSMLVVQEDTKDLETKDRMAAAMGTPRVGTDAAPIFRREAIAADSLAHAKPAAEYDARTQSAWLTRLQALDGKTLVTVIVACGLLVFALLARSLKSGSGDKPLTGG